MWDFDYTNTNAIKSLLYENGLAMNKKFGQNFLISASSIKKIVDTSLFSISCIDKVYEIGPGLGCLTAEFLERKIAMKVFEIDKGFVDILKNKAFEGEDVEIVEGDVMKTLFLQETCPSLLIGNLPYNISAPLIANILYKKIGGKLPDKMVFLLQKEVAYKFAAKERGKDFSHLSFTINLSYDAKVAFSVSRGVFFPSPNVDSALLVLDKHPELISDPNSRADCIDFAAKIFENPRKTISNNLKKTVGDALPQILDSLGISMLKRPAELSVSDIISIYNACKNPFF